MELVSSEKTELKGISMSQDLRTFLTMQILLKEKHTDEIYEEDIDEYLERIKSINEEVTNFIIIPGQVALEFMNVIKEKVKRKQVDLGSLEIDIGGIDFSVKEFIENTKELSYSLKLKIHSIQDLKQEELKFLESRYGIIYEYAANTYHIDELMEVISKMKNFIKKNEKEIKVSEKNLERASGIANVIFKNFELIVPEERVFPSKEVVFRNGQKMQLPKFTILEDTRTFANLQNIFSNGVADLVGMKKLCKECLRNDGYQVIETLDSIRNRLVEEVVINNKEYGIKVTEEGMTIVEM